MSDIDFTKTTFDGRAVFKKTVFAAAGLVFDEVSSNNAALFDNADFSQHTDEKAVVAFRNPGSWSGLVF